MCPSLSSGKSKIIKVYNQLNLDYQKIDSMYKLYNRLNNISKNIKYDYKVASYHKNMVYNRYTNVLATEISRYKSSHIPYINANIVKSNHKYILSQGPLNLNMVDFIQMIWDENVGSIVCLANQIENGRVKFDNYFNDNKPIYFGKYRVNVVSIDNKTDNLIIRTINISTESLNKKIIHIQYTEWPDHSSPSNLSNITNMMNLLINNHLDKPILIHCSAGIGRTGSFLVAFDNYLGIIMYARGLIDYKQINICDNIYNFRKYREGLVQTADQLEFCYLILLYSLDKMIGSDSD